MSLWYVILHCRGWQSSDKHKVSGPVTVEEVLLWDLGGPRVLREERPTVRRRGTIPTIVGAGLTGHESRYESTELSSLDRINK